MKTYYQIRKKYLKFLLILIGFIFTVGLAACCIFRKKADPPVNDVIYSDPDNSIQNKYGVPANYE